ncbi:MAG: hypothetical protein KDC90_17765 [Ignavibacteriae bacterium]|nr:hypothetical protein [Ignavibacteriota bacterium]
MKKLSIILLMSFVMLGCSENSEELKANNNSSIQQTKKEKGKNEKPPIIFERKSEPRENAFSLLVPKGWQIDGGIFRVDPTVQGGPSQSIAAKLDFAIKKDTEGSVMIRWLPDVLFFDMRNSPAGQMGLFPEGINYQGMTVYNLMNAENFISRIAFPYAHPQAQNVQIIERKNLQTFASQYATWVKQAMPYTTMSYDAAYLKIQYSEAGKVYDEYLLTLIENWGQLGAGMWGNKETFLVRAPQGELEKWESIFSVIQNSVKLNINWLMAEIKGQAARGEIAANTQKEIERIGREITEHKQKTNAEINNDMFLTLTEQEEYVNPYNNEVETGTNQWKHRWVNESGDVIYTDEESYDPNIDINLNSSDFKRSNIRKRFPN